MTINEINTLINIIIKLGIFIVSIILVFRLYKFITIKYIEIKNKKLDNEKITLYANINPALVKDELLKLIRSYVARYMTKNIIVNQINFIKNDQADQMVRDVVKDITFEMSDLYLSYCKLLYVINNEDDLTKIIYRLTVDVVLDAITEYNKTQD